MTLSDDPLSTVNIKKGHTPGSISGAEFLRRWHTRRNANHPLRVKERQEAVEYIRARQMTVAPITVKTTVSRIKKIKKEPPKLDPDGKYRL